MFNFLVIFLFTFAVYFFGLSQAVFGGDSGDIILASWFGGVAHPPGYPLNTMIGFIFTHLPFNASVAYKANLLAATLQAVSVGVLFLILRLLTKNGIVAAIGSLTLAFIPLFWLYGHVAEVFQLLLVLVAYSVFFLLQFRETVILKKPKTKFLYLSVLFYGLAVFHHQTAVLIAPALIYLIYKTDKKIYGDFKLLLKLGGFFLLGFLPYLFIPFAASRATPINWDDATNPANFIRLITRADYGTFLASKSLVGALAKERLLQIVSYFYFVKTDFTIAGLLFAGLGALYLFFKDKVLFWFLTLAFFFAGPFFLAYSSFVLAGEFLFGVWERFLLLSYFFICLFLSFGILAFYLFLEKRIIRSFKLGSFLLRKQLISLTVLLAFFSFPLTLILVNFTKTDLSGNLLGDFLGNDVLASALPNSIIFLYDDTLVFNTQYVYYTKGMTDAKIIVGGSLRHKYYRKQLANTYKDLNFGNNFLEERNEQSANFMVDLIEANKDKFPVYSFSFTIKIPGKAWVPVGLLYKLVDEEGLGDTEFKKINGDVLSRFRLKPSDLPNFYTHFATDHIKLIYNQAFVDIGNAMLARQLYEQGVAYFGKALVLKKKEDAYLGLGRAFLELSKCSDAKAAFSLALEQNSHSISALANLEEIARECDKNENEASRYKNMLENEKKRLEPVFK